MEREHSGRPIWRGRCGPGVLLGLLAALAVLGSVLIIAGTDSVAHAQDTPAEDEPAEESPPGDAPPGDEPPEEDPPADGPAEEGTADDAADIGSTDPDPPPAGGAPAEEVADDDVAAGEFSPAGEHPPKGPPSVISGHYGCPQRPPSRYHDGVPSWSDWCLDPDYWIVEVTCEPVYANAGSTVRFDADPSVVPDLVMYDLCGNLDPLSECPPPSPAAPQPRAPANRLEQSTVPRTEFGEDIEEALSPDEFVETGADAPGVTGAGDEPDGTIESALEPDDVFEAGIAPASTAGDSGATDEPGDTAAAADGPCGPVWPPGTWYQYERQDPITGEIMAGGRATGSWFGTRHHEAADAPAFVAQCAAGRLDIVVRTGGAVFAAYGQGVLVDYRAGDTVRSEEWNELDSPDSRRAGVAIPRWFIVDFVDLLAANPAGDLFFRVFGHDGAEVGTASFDLAAIDMMLAPIREICPVRDESTPAGEN